MARETIPKVFLEEWGRTIADPALEQHGATRYRSPEWRAEISLPVDMTWSAAGFSTQKLGYLLRKYPLEALSSEGCIELAQNNTILYRRVDLTRGWLADTLYLQHLGWRGRVIFYAPGSVATLHAVRLSCVFPAVLREGCFSGVHRLLRRTLKRAIVHRLERRYESFGQAARANAWAHRLASEDDMRRAISVLED